MTFEVFFFFFFKFFLFIISFGCAGSWLLCGFCSSCCEQELTVVV